MLKLVGNHAGGDRAEHFAVFTRLDRDDTSKFGQTLGQFGHGVQFVRLAFGAALAQHFDAALVGLGERESPGVAERDNCARNPRRL